MKYQEWLNQWLNNYVKPTAKQKTYTRYAEAVSTHIIPKLGEYELGELTPLILQQFITELLEHGNIKTGKGLSDNSVNGIISIIQSSLRVAYNIGVVDNYIADKIKRPKITEKKVDSFTQTEQEKIERAVLNCNKPKMKGILLCMYIGLRIGELLALEWKDVDLHREQISITKSCHDGKDKNGVFTRITDTPKTITSNRTIPIPKQLIPLLKDMKRQSDSNYVIESKGKPIGVRTYQRTFERLLKRLNISHKGFHALRHTFATRAVECCVDVKTLSEILGHKNAMVTINRYAHSLAEHKREMMDKIGKRFSTLRNTQIQLPLPQEKCRLIV